MKKIIFIFLLIFGSMTIFGDDIKETPAFQKLNMQRIKIETELVNLKTKFLENHPDVQAKKTELQITKREIENLLLHKEMPANTFGTNLAALLLKKTQTETELLNLLRGYTPTHPEVVAKKAELKIISQEVETILPPPVQVTNDQKKDEPQKLQVKLFEIKNKQPETLVNAIMALGSGAPNTRIDPNNNLKTITVRDFPENIAAIEGALKRLDLPDAAPVSIQTQSLFNCSFDDEVMKPEFSLKKLNRYFRKLKTTLSIKTIVYVNSFINRVNDGGSLTSNEYWIRQGG